MFPRYDVPRDFDLLTIDTDYNDYWTSRFLGIGALAVAVNST